MASVLMPEGKRSMRHAIRHAYAAREHLGRGRQPHRRVRCGQRSPTGCGHEEAESSSSRLRLPRPGWLNRQTRLRPTLTSWASPVPEPGY
jgi:hypothetical protein